MKNLSIGLALGLLGGFLLLVTLPRVDLPCEVLLSYSGKQYVKGRGTLFFVRDVRKEKVLRGRGRFGPSSLTCEIDLQGSKSL